MLFLVIKLQWSVFSALLSECFLNCDCVEVRSTVAASTFGVTALKRAQPAPVLLTTAFVSLVPVSTQ